MDQLRDRHVGLRRPASARLLVLLPLLAVTALAAACQFPRDTADTLDNLRDGGTLRVGITEAEPWVSLERPEPSGVEIGLVREFASRLGAPVDYTTGSEQELVEALHARELDLVVGGITDRTRWKQDVAMTKPYLTTHLVVGAPRARELDDGERVVVENGTHDAALLERNTSWIPVPRDSLEGLAGRPAVVHDWLLDDLRLRPVETLHHDEHVMLAAPGENAFLVELEHFLLDSKPRALRLLDREGRP